MAANAVKNAELSIREASSVSVIPKSTLGQHMNKKVPTPGRLGRFCPI